jgi:hypothetical protein
MSVTALALAILTLVPHLDPVRADYHAAIVAGVAADDAEAVALIVNGAHESGFGWDYETCRAHGDGGEGLYGLGVGYERFACAPPEVQARGAVIALREKGWPARPLRAFRGYLGARSDNWPEARARLSLWTLTLERMRCMCSF